MSILLPGGAGYIGSHTAVELLKAGKEIVIIDNFSNSKPEVLDKIKEISGKDFKFYEIDYLDKEKLEVVSYMIDVNLFFYVGIFLAIVGSLATAWGPGVKDPIIRTFNTEVASIGVCLVLLTYNHVLALLTLLATTVVITFVLFRAIIRLEEMGADV